MCLTRRILAHHRFIKFFFPHMFVIPSNFEVDRSSFPSLLPLFNAVRPFFRSSVIFLPTAQLPPFFFSVSCQQRFPSPSTFPPRRRPQHDVAFVSFNHNRLFLVLGPPRPGLCRLLLVPSDGKLSPSDCKLPDRPEPPNPSREFFSSPHSADTARASH